MPNFKNIFRYWRHYGTYSLVGHVWELLAINPYRFRAGYHRTVPQFPCQYIAPEMQTNEGKTQQKIKICYLIHYFYPAKRGGTERFVLNLAQQQQRLGNEVVVITLGNEFLSKYDKQLENMYYREYSYEGVPVMEIRHQKAPLGLYYKDMMVDDTTMYQFAKALIQQEQIHVVHAAYPQPFYSFAMAARDMNVPVVMTGTDFNMLCHYATMVDRNGDFCSGSALGLKCKQTCKTYGCADLEIRYKKAKQYIESVQWLTVPSVFVANVFMKEFPGLPVQAVPHGIGEVFVPSEKRTATKRFVYAGTLSELKGVHLLIAAFERLQGEYQLDIYGPTNSTYAQKLMQTKDQRIQFHGAVEASQMVDVYQQADCVVVPSIWYETYNFVVREALACGCLVVASAIGAMPEAIDIGQNGFTFVPGDADNLYEILQQAAMFEWDNYKQQTFPTVAQEGQIYNQIYRRVLPN